MLSRQPTPEALHTAISTSADAEAARQRTVDLLKTIDGSSPTLLPVLVDAINWPLLGKFLWKVFIQLNLGARGIIDSLLRYLYDSPEIFCALNGIGFPGEIDIEVVQDSYRGLFNYMEQLQREFPGGIKGYEQMEFTAVHKVDYLPL